MSAGREAQPVSIAPDLSYGVTDDVTLAIVHSRYATTGFRGSAGGAFCVSETTTGCAGLYNNFGLEAWTALLRGPLSIVGGGGVEDVNVDKGLYDLKLGLKARIAVRQLSFTLTPSLLIAANKRADTPANPDVLYVPVGIGLRVTRRASFAIGSGIKGPISGFDHNWQAPLGVSATYAVGPVVLGASWVYGSLVSAARNPPSPMPAVEGVDVRVMQVWISLAFGTGHAPAHAAEPTHELAPTSRRRAAAPRVAPSFIAPPALALQLFAAIPMVPQPAARARVAPTEVPPPALLTKAAISTVAAEHVQETKKCQGPSPLRGGVSIEFEIDPTGAVTTSEVSHAATTVKNTRVPVCLLRALRTWRFPPQAGAIKGVYTVSFQ